MSSSLVHLRKDGILIHKEDAAVLLSLEEALSVSKEIKDVLLFAEKKSKLEKLSHYISDWLHEIPAGVFSMGIDNGDPWEGPSHFVELTQAFLMAKSFVSQSLYKLVMEENTSVHLGSELPVDSVSWYEALHFCNRLSDLLGFEPCYEFRNGAVHFMVNNNGFRLPTEAEWYWAAHCGVASVYAGGDELERVSGWRKDSTHIPQVCAGAPNAFGLFDMSGLCFSWCYDSFAPFSMERKKNPVIVHETDVHKVCRGGAWNRSEWFSRIHFRCGMDAENGYDNVGIRLVRNAH